jgi:hypothetical protein
MAFTDLTESLQNVVMLNFETFGKFLLIFGVFFFCLHFINTFNPKNKSPFFAISYLKGISFVVCKIYIFLSPLMIFLLYPQVSLNVVLTVLISIYSVLFVIFGLIIIPINMLLYGVSFAYDLLGVKSSTSKIKNEVDRITGVNVK